MFRFDVQVGAHPFLHQAGRKAQLFQDVQRQERNGSYRRFLGMEERERGRQVDGYLLVAVTGWDGKCIGKGGGGMLRGAC